MGSPATWEVTQECKVLLHRPNRFLCCPMQNGNVWYIQQSNGVLLSMNLFVMCHRPSAFLLRSNVKSIVRSAYSLRSSNDAFSPYLLLFLVLCVVPCDLGCCQGLSSRVVPCLVSRQVSRRRIQCNATMASFMQLYAICIQVDQSQASNKVTILYSWMVLTGLCRQAGKGDPVVL